MRDGFQAKEAAFRARDPGRRGGRSQGIAGAAMNAAVHDPYAQVMPSVTPTWTAPGSGHGTIAVNGTYTADVVYVK
jgi:hypothetical protein